MQCLALSTQTTESAERGIPIFDVARWKNLAPLGPFLVTPDEIEDVNNLNMWLKVNGDIKQQGNTSDFIFGIPKVVSYLSQFMTLLPGDIITTGTPPGVALGMKEPIYLKSGDIVELGIDGLGVSKQNVVSSLITA